MRTELEPISMTADRLTACLEVRRKFNLFSIFTHIEGERGDVLTLVERGAAARQRRVVHKIMVQLDRLVSRYQKRGGAGGLQDPALFIVDEDRDEQQSQYLVVDRKGVVWGKRWTVSLDLGGERIITKK